VLRGGFTGCFIAAFLAVAALQAIAQQDDGPILRPKTSPKPAVKSASPATLLVICDLACTWKLDGKPQGRIAPGDPVIAPVSMGQHLVDAATADGLDKVENEIDIKAQGQTIVRLVLQPVRDARLKAAQEAEDNAAQELKEKQQQDLKALAGQCYTEGLALYDQQRYPQAKVLFDKACSGGSGDACLKLGQIESAWQPRIGGLLSAADYARVAGLYKNACDDGSLAGCDALARHYFEGHGGGTQDYRQARVFSQRACDGGMASACEFLAGLYYDGHGGAKDSVQAHSLYQKACSAGLKRACDELGWFF